MFRSASSSLRWLAVALLGVGSAGLVPVQGCHLVLGQFEVPPPIGDPCTTGDQCGDAECIANFSCTIECVTAADCAGQGPGGVNGGGTPNVCVDIEFLGRRCVAGCASPSDCDRFGPGFGCVPYQGAPPGMPGVCTAPIALGNGDPCAGSGCDSFVCLGGNLFCTDDCQSSQACVGIFLGGANVFGGSNACVDAGPSYGQKCLPSCSSTAECSSRYATAALTCVTTQDVGGATVSVCVPPP